jgi:hypothetical protein
MTNPSIKEVSEYVAGAKKSGWELSLDLVGT